jgi:deazaflavin-dependent oxidoreductase (nitroreductase family)
VPEVPASTPGPSAYHPSVARSDRLARFNRRLFNPVIRTVAGRRGFPVAVVEHRGRRSGRRYRTPVLAFRAGDGYVVALFYGADRDWVRNVLAAGSCTLVRGGRRVRLTDPSMFDAGAGSALLPAFMRPSLRLLRVTRVLRLSAA